MMLGYEEYTRLAELLGAADDAVAPRIARYELGPLIGRGATGDVYRATDSVDGHVVALKVRHGFHSDRDSELRFRQEANCLRHLDDAGIARFLDAGFDADRQAAYIAMEFVDGPDLLTWRRLAPRTPGDCAAMAAVIAEAVNHAHTKGVIHRDLKPSNIRIDATGKPKILDFGIAHALDPELRATGLSTRPNALVGTIAYMSPEQLTGGAAAADTRFDVYALGAILYQLISDRLPLDVTADPVLRAIDRVKNEAPSPLSSSIVPGVARDLEAIVGRALAKDPADRYPSAAALGSDLRAFLADRPVEARPPGAAVRLLKVIRRSPVVSGLSLALVAGLFAATGWWRTASEERFRAETHIRSTVAALVEIGRELANGGAPAASRGKMVEMLRGEFGADFDGKGVRVVGPERLAEVLEIVADVSMASGAYADALPLRRRVVDLRRQLAAEARDGRDPTPELDLAVAIVKRGDALRALSREAEGVLDYEDALARNEKVCAAWPRSLRALDDLFHSHQRQADAELRKNGLSDLARARLLAAEKTAERLLALDPNRPASIRAWGAAHLQGCDVRAAAVDDAEIDRREEHIRGALAAARRILEVEPGATASRRMAFRAQLSAAMECARYGTADDCERFLVLAKDLIERQSEFDPDGLEAVRWRIEVGRVRAVVEEEANRFREALGRYGAILPDVRRLMRDGTIEDMGLGLQLLDTYVRFSEETGTPIPNDAFDELVVFGGYFLGNRVRPDLVTDAMRVAVARARLDRPTATAADVDHAGNLCRDVFARQYGWNLDGLRFITRVLERIQAPEAPAARARLAAIESDWLANFERALAERATRAQRRPFLPEN